MSPTPTPQGTPLDEIRKCAARSFNDPDRTDTMLRDAICSACDEGDRLAFHVQRLTADISTAQARASAAESDLANARTALARLWMLLDDIDTQDDASKSNDAHFRKCCYEIQQKRHAIFSGEKVEALLGLRGFATNRPPT